VETLTVMVGSGVSGRLSAHELIIHQKAPSGGPLTRIRSLI